LNLQKKKKKKKKQGKLVPAPQKIHGGRKNNPE